MKSSPRHSPEIRRAGPGDGAAIAAFNRALAHETESRELPPAVVEAGVAAVLSDPAKGFYLVAELDGAVRACLLVTHEWSDWRNGVFWWIQSVYVAPGYRRRGLYRALYAELKRRAAEAGNVCAFRLYADRDNRRAHAVYRALGMRECRYSMFESK